MEQYISKSALVAMIRKRLLPVIRDKHYDEWEEGQNSERIAILDIIDTLEMKEVDIDALGVLANHLIACNAHGVTPKYSDRELDFLEGLANNKAQKVE